MAKIEPFLGHQLQLWREQTPEERVATGSSSRIRVFVHFRGDSRALQNTGLVIRSVEGSIAIGDVDLADLERVAALDSVVFIEGDKPTEPHLNVSVPQIHADVVHGAPLSLTGKGVIVGIVDTGIDIQHRAFRNPDGSSRVLSIWDQTLSQPAQGNEKLPPAPFTKGILFDKDAIKSAIDHPDQPFRHVDTDGHGTHVAGIAAGNGSQSGHCRGANTYIGVALEADLIIVKTTFADGDNSDGVNYIFQCATTLNKAAAVNMSLGGQIGAHDGTFAAETRLDGYVGAGRVIVVSAGNDGGGELHASKAVAANAAVTLKFTVPGNDKVPDSFDIWYSGAARLTLTLTPPGGPAYASMIAGAPAADLAGGPAGGDKVNAHSIVNHPLNGRHNIGFSIRAAAAGRAIAAGDWVITVQETAGAATVVDAWIARQGKDPYASFVSADHDPARTVTIPATARNVIAVGAYDADKSIFSSQYELADFSSHGPTLDGRQKPDISAPGVNVTSVASGERSHWYCCDCCLDFYVNKDGTSMAAPHVTGVVALMLQRNRNLTYDQVRQQIRSSGRQPDTIPLPDFNWGYGMVDAQSACSGVPPAAVGGGGGGGGGGGAHMTLPVVAGVATQPAIAARLRMLEQQYADRPLWHEVGALVSNHFDEVLRLINRNRRVAVAWHRMNGPQLIGDFVGGAGDLRYSPLALRAEALPIAQVDRMLVMLARYGSPSLSSDVTRYRSLILAVPRMNRSNLELLATG